MDKILTIAIPMFNMEKYIQRCLDSLLIDDTNLFKELEIIVINDGSKDKSLAIAKSYESRFPEVIRVIDKANGNYGSCLNVAFKEAKGTYFRTLDADDWFDTEELTRYITFLRKLTETPDLILTNYIIEYNNRTEQHFLPISYSSIQSIETFNIQTIDFCIHTATFATSVLRDIRLSEKISYTDTEVLLYSLPKIQTYITVPVSLYHYYIGRDDQSMSGMSLIRNIDHQRQIITRFLNEYDSQKPNANIQVDLFLKQILRLYYILNLTQKLPENDYKKFLNIDYELQHNDSSHIYERLLEQKYYRIKLIKLWKFSPQILFPIVINVCQVLLIVKNRISAVLKKDIK